MELINLMTQTDLTYTRDTKWNRVLDALYFLHHVTLLDTKYMMNHDMRHPLHQPAGLTINMFMEDTVIANLPWPFFVELHSMKN